MQYEMRSDDVNSNAALGQDSQGNMHILRRGVVHIGGGVNEAQPPLIPDQRTYPLNLVRFAFHSTLQEHTPFSPATSPLPCLCA